MAFDWNKAYCGNCGSLTMEVLGAGISGWIPCYKCNHETNFTQANESGFQNSARPILSGSPNHPSGIRRTNTEAVGSSRRSG